MSTKECTKCHEEKNINEFYKCRTSRFGKCRQCLHAERLAKQGGPRQRATKLQQSGKQEIAQRMLSEGATAEEIADEIGVSEQTVRAYIRKGIITVIEDSDNSQSDAASAHSSGVGDSSSAESVGEPESNDSD